MKIVYTFGKPKKWYHFIPAWLISDVGYFMPNDYVLQKIRIKHA